MIYRRKQPLTSLEIAKAAITHECYPWTHPNLRASFFHLTTIISSIFLAFVLVDRWCVCVHATMTVSESDVIRNWFLYVYIVHYLKGNKQGSKRALREHWRTTRVSSAVLSILGATWIPNGDPSGASGPLCTHFPELPWSLFLVGCPFRIPHSPMFPWTKTEEEGQRPFESFEILPDHSTNLVGILAFPNV